MADAALAAEYEGARQEHASAVRALVPLLVRMAVASVAEVLPGAHELEVLGQFNGVRLS